jgi:hypothetical protein
MSAVEFSSIYGTSYLGRTRSSMYEAVRETGSLLVNGSCPELQQCHHDVYGGNH